MIKPSRKPWPLIRTDEMRITIVATLKAAVNQNPMSLRYFMLVFVSSDLSTCATRGVIKTDELPNCLRSGLGLLPQKIFDLPLNMRPQGRLTRTNEAFLAAS